MSSLLTFLDTKTLLLSFMAIYVITTLFYFHSFQIWAKKDESSLSCGDCSKCGRTGANQVYQSSQTTQKSRSSSKGYDTSYTYTSCLKSNSKEWLESERYSNDAHESEVINDGRMDMADFIRKTILDLPRVLERPHSDIFSFLMDRTLCHANSRLLNDTSIRGGHAPAEGDVEEHDPYAVRLWAVRLIYLAMHYHQHYWAIPEAKARIQNVELCGREMEEKRVGWFDYECPDAKYLVVALGGYGLGANMRIVAASMFILGLQSNRVILFVNDANGYKNPEKKSCSHDHQSPDCTWPLVSCDRHNFQCFFMPESPCSITQNDLNNAYHLQWNESRLLSVRGWPPKDHKDDKVWVLKPSIVLLGKTENFKEPTKRLTGYVKEFLKAVPATDPRFSILKKATQSISVRDARREGYHYMSATDKMRHALTMYAMRPGLHKVDHLNHIMSGIVPENFKPDSSIGLPIRGSDKCRTESECLSFFEHMQVTSYTWTKHLHATNEFTANPIVVFTSEDKLVIQNQTDFVHNSALQAKFPYKFQFLTNTHDVTPDSGFIAEVVAKGQMTADEALMGSLSSLKFQMLARVSIGNCCSNFHILLNDFLMEGCGAASKNDFLCLNEFDGDPALKLCCGWHLDCVANKKEYLAMVANGTITRPLTFR